MCGCLSRADDSKLGALLCVGNHQEPSRGRATDGDESLLPERMILIGKRAGQRIAKYGGGFVEVYPMLAKIGISFLCVPSELHSAVPLYFGSRRVSTRPTSDCMVSR